MKTYLSRRQVLRGILGGAGVSIALPVLDAMLDDHGEVFAQTMTAPPKRLGVFFFGNGVRLDQWTPARTGASWELSAELAPFEDVKPYLNVVSGYRAKAGYGRRGHHDGAAAILSGHPFIELPHAETSYSSKFGGPTIDQVAADAIGRGTLFPSIQVGCSKRVTTGEGPSLQFASHRGPDAPVAPEYNPRALFDRLFASFTPASTEDPTNRLRGSVLDAVREDARRLSSRLGAKDRMRLDQHLTGIAQLQREISALPPVLTQQCTVPAAPTETNADVMGLEPMEEAHRAMTELIVLAFACDLTRVVSYMFTGGVGGIIYHMLGATTEQHGLTHEPDQQRLVHRTVHWNMQQFAHLLRRLMATPEGRGNLLDSCVWLCSSDCAEGLTHSSDDYPILVAGRAGGFLKYPGVHHRGTLADNTSDVLLTVLRAAGVPAREVGSAQGLSSHPCAEIEA